MTPLITILNVLVLAFLTLLPSLKPSRLSDGAGAPLAIPGPDHALSIIPGLVGFGSTTVGGSGRHLSPPRTRIIRVHALADSGPGTLRECISATTARTCIFDISGEIRLRSMLRIKHPYITIAGQTAPSSGITITNGGIKIETHDVVIQHLAIRPGDRLDGPKPLDRDGVSIGASPPASAYNIVLDHLSLTWAVDENASTWSPTTHHVTIAHSIIAEGLHRSIHPKGPHSKGLLIGNGSRCITIALNLLAFNEERNPYLKPGSSTEFVNNIVYGWGPHGGWSLCNLSDNDGNGIPVDLSFIGNTYKPGPQSAHATPLYAKPLAPHSEVYQSLNRWFGDRVSEANSEEIANFSSNTFQAERPPSTVSGRRIRPPMEAYTTVLDTAGSRPRERATADRRIVAEVRTGRGTLKDCLVGCRRSTGSLAPHITQRELFQVPGYPMNQATPGGYTALERALHRRSTLLSRVR